MRRAWRFGGLALEAQVDDARLLPALRGVLSGYTGAPVEAARVGVAARLDLAGEPRRGFPTAPRFRPTTPGQPLVDRSEAWDATWAIAPDGRGVEAAAHLRDLRDEPAVFSAMTVTFLRVAAALAAPVAGGLLVHGCAMVAPSGDRAVLFVGASGDGKTTMARRLSGWHLLADDCAWIGREPGGAWVVGGTPFRGKEGLARDGTLAPLAQVVALAPRAPSARLVVLGQADAFGVLLARVLWFAAEPTLGQRVFDLVGALVEAVPCARLESGLEHDVAPLVAGLPRDAQSA